MEPVISEKGRTTISPSVRRFQRYTGVFVLGVVLLTYGSTLVTGGNWPRGDPWTGIGMTALGIGFLVGPPREQERPFMRAFAWIAIGIALVSSIVAMVIFLRGA